MSAIANIDLERQTTRFDAQEDEENIPPEILKRLSSFEKEVSNVLSEVASTSPSRRLHGVTRESPIAGNPESSGPMKREAKKKRDTSMARYRDIDLATELGRGLVAEIRKLQSEILAKDELLKDSIQSLSRKDALYEEVELKLRTICASEENLKSANWELELHNQNLEESVKAYEVSRIRLENETSKLAATSLRQQDHIESLEEAEQQGLALVEELRGAGINIENSHKAIQDDLREEIYSLQKRVEDITAEFDAYRLAHSPRPLLTSPQKYAPDNVVQEDTPETPPGSPPLSPIKGTPHRNATLESESLKGTLYYNQSKMLRQKKELEREKVQRMMLQRQIKEISEELESMRNRRGTGAPRHRHMKSKNMSHIKCRSKGLEYSESWRIASAESGEPLEDFWEDQIGLIESDEGSPRPLRPLSISSILWDPSTPTHETEAESGSLGTIHSLPGADVQDCIFQADLPRSQARSGVEAEAIRGRHCSDVDVPLRNLQTEFDELSIPNRRSTDSGPQSLEAELSSCVLSSGSLGVAEPIHIATRDAAVMTDISWQNFSTDSMQVFPSESEHSDYPVNIPVEAKNDHARSTSAAQLYSTAEEEPQVEHANLYQPASAELILTSSAFSTSPLNLLGKPGSVVNTRDVGTQYEIMVEPSTTPCSPSGESIAAGQRHEPLEAQRDTSSRPEHAQASPPTHQDSEHCHAIRTPDCVLDQISGTSSNISKCPGSSGQPDGVLITEADTTPNMTGGSAEYCKLERSVTADPLAGIVSPFAIRHSYMTPGSDHQQQARKIREAGEPGSSIPASRLHSLELELKASKQAVDTLTSQKSKLLEDIQRLTPKKTSDGHPEIERSDHPPSASKQQISSISEDAVSALFDTVIGEITDSVTHQSLAADTAIQASSNVRELLDYAGMRNRERHSSVNKIDSLIGSVDVQTSSKDNYLLLKARQSDRSQPLSEISQMAPPKGPSTARDTLRGRVFRDSPVKQRTGNLIKVDLEPSHKPFPVRSHSCRSISSLSSFASDVEDRLSSRMYTKDNRILVENPTDPATIESITRTMIGMGMYKYTRRAARQGLSEKRHKRYFWIHPYTKTLYWSVYNPVNAPEGAIIKSAPILAFHVEEDYNPLPPGLCQRSLYIDTPRRLLKITAVHSTDHDDWVQALQFLIHGPPPDNHIPQGSEKTESDHRDFNPSATASSGVQSHAGNARQSQTGRMSSTSQRRDDKSISRKLSAFFRSSIPKSDLGERDNNRTKSPDNTALFPSPRKLQNPSLEFLSTNLEVDNVRACCGGRHDVTDLCTRPLSPVRKSTSSRII